MKETGLMFKAPLVRAILDGSKTQTRRVVKPIKASIDPHDPDQFPQYMRYGAAFNLPCPMGHPGDRIYVRETWQHANFPLGPYQDGTPVFYRADYLDDPHGPDGEKSPEGKYRHWSPAIHMRKADARIWLEVTGVRAERLQQITEADCIAEGIHELPHQAAERSCWWTSDVAAGAALHGRTPRNAFQLLWESTGGDWNANPWVWVIDFKRIDKP